jgi:hypothetical protein
MDHFSDSRTGMQAGHRAGKTRIVEIFQFDRFA